MLNGAYLNVLYADDIRDEANGRNSILGCFSRGNVLRITEQPMQLKRLALFGTLCVPNTVEIEKLRIVIQTNERLVTDQDVSHLLAEPDERTVHNGEFINQKMFSFEFMLENIVLLEPTIFAVSAFVNESEVKGTRFLITNE